MSIYYTITIKEKGHDLTENKGFRQGLWEGMEGRDRGGNGTIII